MPLDNIRSADPASGQSNLRGRLARTRQTSGWIAEPLTEEDQIVQAMEDASPTKWHLAHTTWFFEELVLKPHDPAYRIFDAHSGETGLRQMIGDVWEWIGSAYLAFPGLKPIGGVVGEYNGKFMCKQFMLKGGSCVTLRGTSARLTGISSIRISAGNSPGSGSRMMASDAGLLMPAHAVNWLRRPTPRRRSSAG